MRLRVIPITKCIIRSKRAVIKTMVASVKAIISPWMRGDSKISKSDDLVVPLDLYALCLYLFFGYEIRFFINCQVHENSISIT